MTTRLRILQMDIRPSILGHIPLRTLTTAEGETHMGRKDADPLGRYGYAAVAVKLRITAKHPLSWTWDGATLKEDAT